jgi:hypothetical protein
MSFNSILSNPAYGYITGSLPSSVSSSGVFLSNFNPNLPLPSNWSGIYAGSGLYLYALSVLIPSPGTNNQWWAWYNYPDTFVAADNSIVTSSLYLPLPDYYPNCSLDLYYIQNQAAINTALVNYSIRTRVYKNGYLIQDTVRPAGGVTDGAVPVQTSEYTVSYPTYHTAYGTACNGDNIKVVYSRA